MNEIRNEGKKVGSLKRSIKFTSLHLDGPRKTERRLNTKIRNERGNITANLTEIKRIIRKSHGQFYINKFDKLDEIKEFLEIKTTETDSRRNRKSEYTYK